MDEILAEGPLLTKKKLVFDKITTFRKTYS
jgi:hypothetical protein